jgi:Arc/MetJ family transcription regulator
MYTHMKTTIEIADALFAEARRVAAREGTTLRNLVEQGLRRVLSDRRAHRTFRLKKATFKGQGLHPDAAQESWDRLRSLSYQDRGGA